MLHLCAPRLIINLRPPPPPLVITTGLRRLRRLHRAARRRRRPVVITSGGGGGRRFITRWGARRWRISPPAGRTGGGVERRFGSVPVHSVFLLPSCEMRYFQYAASRAKYTHVVSRPSLAAPGMMRRMFFAKFFLLFCRTPPRRRLLSHHDVRSWVGIWSSLLRTTFPMKVSCR